MKVLGATTWRCLCAMTMMMMVVIGVFPSLGYATTVTFDINSGADGYSAFLRNYRNAVAAPTLACGLQSTSNTANYIYVELKLSNAEIVTVGIATTDLYVWGYQDNVKRGKNYRARFFKDVPKLAYDNLFKGLDKLKSELESNYNKLVPRTDFDRKKLDLKIKTIEDVVRGVYGKTDAELKKGTAEANFFFIMAQMVSEAARFQFMEDAILAYNTKSLSSKMIDFQSNWDDISSAIHTAEEAKPKCGNFAKELKVGSFKYKSVDEIKGEMGILKFKKNKTLYQMFKAFLLGFDGFKEM